MIQRKHFVKRVGLGALALAFRPARVLAGPLQEMISHSVMHSPEAVDLGGGIIDLHCHQSLKMYLLEKKMWHCHHPGPGANEIHMQVDLTQLQSGCVKGMMATHYLVEASIEQNWDTLKKLWPILSRIFRRLTRRIENSNESNISQIRKMIKLLEEQLDECNKRQSEVQFKVARNYREFSTAIQEGKIAVAHAIEGAHALGRNLGDPANYLINLKELHDRGVCMMTLSHFFRNDIAYPVDGMSPDSKRAPGMAWEYTPDKDHGLTDVGVAVVNSMLEIGMIVDLNHTTPGVRQHVFALNRVSTERRGQENKPPRPLVFTHTGAQQIYEYYDQGHYPYYKYYCVSDEEIAAIEECNGVIGILAENFWLTGADTHLRKEFLPATFRYGIPYIIQTIKYINSRTQSKTFDHVAIGTDFDGLADAPADLYVHSQLRDLFAAMKADPDIPATAIPKICYENARRVLILGWG